MRAFRDYGLYGRGPKKSLHVQNTEGVHLSLSPKLGTVPNRAFREGVHLESVHLERFVCIKVIIIICFLYNLYYYKSSINKAFAEL